MAGIYVHIPFCGQFCTYCSFYSVKGKEYREQYLSALRKEIEYRKDFFRNIGGVPQTVYLGGGTPSIFSPQILGEILRDVTSAFGFTPVEATVEVNPNDISREYAKGLASAGFTRISMGVQSFVDEHLQWMNRRHNAHEAADAYNFLQQAGFSNISLDLIFGFNSLTDSLWEYNLQKICELAPMHISAYQMGIEPGSVLWRKLQKGEYQLLPDDDCLNQYLMLQHYLHKNGYMQYEVSNFARTDSSGKLCKSLHNSSYWTREPYLGLGPAAHSFNGTHRLWNNASVAKYCRHYLNGPDESACSKACGSEKLGPRDIFNESVMLGLRTTGGVEISALDSGLFNKIEKEIARHHKLGNLDIDGNRIRIPSDKLFVSDGIIMDLFV